MKRLIASLVIATPVFIGTAAFDKPHAESAQSVQSAGQPGDVDAKGQCKVGCLVEWKPVCTGIDGKPLSGWRNVCFHANCSVTYGPWHCKRQCGA